MSLADNKPRLRWACRRGRCGGSRHRDPHRSGLRCGNQETNLGPDRSRAGGIPQEDASGFSNCGDFGYVVDFRCENERLFTLSPVSFPSPSPHYRFAIQNIRKIRLVASSILDIDTSSISSQPSHYFSSSLLYNMKI